MVLSRGGLTSRRAHDCHLSKARAGLEAGHDLCGVTGPPPDERDLEVDAEDQPRSPRARKTPAVSQLSVTDSPPKRAALWPQRAGRERANAFRDGALDFRVAPSADSSLPVGRDVRRRSVEGGRGEDQRTRQFLSCYWLPTLLFLEFPPSSFRKPLLARP